MPEVEEQLREYWTSITAAQPSPMAADVMESAPITERHSDPDDAPSRFTARRQLLAAAAAVLLVAGVVTVYALVSGDGDDDPTVTTDSPPAPEGRETEEVDDPEPVTSEQVDGSVDDGGQEEAAKVTGTAAETWLPDSAERDVAIIPWRGGFLAVRPVDGGFWSGHRLVEAETWESPDGVEWSSAPNIMFPPGEFIRSDGQHVVVTGGLSEEELPDGVVESHAISASDDLVEWRTWDLTPELPGDLPSGTKVNVDIQQLQVLPDGWAAASTLTSHVDFWSLLPPDLRDAFDPEGGYESREDESGITFTPDGGETVFLSWDDLGVDRATFQQLTNGDTTQRMVTADWEGELVVHQAEGLTRDPSLVAGSDGVLASDDRSGLLYSTDGETWSDLPAPPWGAQTLSGLARLPDGVVAVADAIWVGDSDGTDWRIVEHPRLDGRTLATARGEDRLSGAAEGFVVIADLADYGDGISRLLDPRAVLLGETRPPPEFVVIASPDGERWLVEDLDVEDQDVDPSQILRVKAIMSGDRVLVHQPGEDVVVYEVE